MPADVLLPPIIKKNAYNYSNDHHGPQQGKHLFCLHQQDWLRKSSDIAFRILDALDEKGWKKNRLADELGVSAQQVSKYVKGEENFKLETLCKLEKVLGVELVTVLQSDQEVKQKEPFEYREQEVRVVQLHPRGFSKFVIEPKNSKRQSFLTAV